MRFPGGLGKLLLLKNLVLATLNLQCFVKLFANLHLLRLMFVRGLTLPTNMKMVQITVLSRTEVIKTVLSRTEVIKTVLSRTEVIKTVLSRTEVIKTVLSRTEVIAIA